MFGALSYAELGCLMPKSGGDYEYSRSIFGNFTGFLVIWTWSLVIIPTSLALAGLTFADYFYALFMPDNCQAPYLVRILIALLAICKYNNRFLFLEKKLYN
jgi:amino acid transporter